jgi:ATP-dependent helicase HrpB
MVGGGGVRLARESAVSKAEYFLALDARTDQRSMSREALVRLASAIEPQWLEEFFPRSVRKVRELHFDESRQRVVARGQTFYRDLLLREDQDASVGPTDAGIVLAATLRPRAREIFTSDPAAVNWLNRLALLRDAMPEQNLPAMDDVTLGDLLEGACAGKRGVEELRRAGSLVQILQNSLNYPLDRIFQTEAPETIDVPTGNRIRLDYVGGRTVKLAVRLQELFGMTQTPRIAAGRVPLVLELLGPNFRPVQVTDDLASFWKNTYPQVRKDLRARYPKHAWPDDPLTAPPQAKGGRRRSS